MFGYLLGTVNKKVVLVKISFDEKKTSNINKTVINKETATFLCGKFYVIEIIDEELNNYDSVDINLIIDAKIQIKLNKKINEFNDKGVVFFYLNKCRALEDIYMHCNNATGTFKQYSLDGEIIGEITFNKGNMEGICKTYKNGKVYEECEYYKNYRNGLCRQYDNNGTIINNCLYKKGVLVNT